MKSVLVTSEVTFVGENYHQVVLSLAENPHIVGLIVIKNRSPKLAFMGLIAALTGAAPKFGFQLFWNTLNPKTSKRIEAFKKNNKEIFFTEDINLPETLAYLENLKLDLLVNARSRCFFREKVLSLPRFGCINIHHGLLPHQRGVMCDFWAHMHGTSFGFTVHQMTKKIDDGPILRVHEVKLPTTNYMNAIFEGSKVEARVLSDVLDDISKAQTLTGIPNAKTIDTKYFKNPSIKDFYRLRMKGIGV